MVKTFLKIAVLIFLLVTLISYVQTSCTEAPAWDRIEEAAERF